MYSQNGYQPPQEIYSNNWAPQEEVYKTSAKRKRTSKTTMTEAGFVTPISGQEI